MSILAGRIPNAPPRPGPTPGYERVSQFKSKKNVIQSRPKLEGTVILCLEVLELAAAFAGGRRWRCRCIAKSRFGNSRVCGTIVEIAEHDLGVEEGKHGKGSCGKPRCRGFVRRLRAAERAGVG